MPPELRLMVWNSAYQKTSEGTVEVVLNIHQEEIAVSLNVSVPSGAMSLRTLLEINKESRDLVKSRFVRPFSPGLPVWKKCKVLTSQDIQVDLERDTLYLCTYIDSGCVLKDIPGWPEVQETNFSLIAMFRFLFGESNKMVLEKLSNIRLNYNFARGLRACCK